MLLLALFSVFVGLMIFAAVHDVATMTIPNWVSIALVAAFFPTAALLGLSLEQVGWHMVVAALGLVVTIVLFSLGVFGGGDAKLLAALCIWFGPSGISPMVLGVAMAGGLLAAIVLAARKLVPAGSAPRFVQKPLTDGSGVPYAVAISAGAFWAAGASPILSEILGRL